MLVHHANILLSNTANFVNNLYEFDAVKGPVFINERYFPQLGTSLVVNECTVPFFKLMTDR